MESKPAYKRHRSMPIASVIVVKNYFPTEAVPNTLQLMEDDIIYVLDNSNPYWWDGLTIDPVGNITRGWFPPTHTKLYTNDKASSASPSTSIPKQNPQNQFNNTSSHSLRSSPSPIVDDSQRDKDFSERDKFMFKEQPKDLQKNILSKLDKDNEKISSSPASIGSLNQTRRQSLKPRHQSYSKSPSHPSFHNKQHMLPKSSSPQLNKHSSIVDANNSNTQSSISIVKNDSSNLTPGISNKPIFKEKNYFTTKQNDSITSANSQFQQLDSRQSSQAFTDATSSTFHLVSNEEVQSFFEPARSQSQPSFNFVPVWIPQFSENYNVVYKNQALNVFTDEPPFIQAEYLNDSSLYESPDTANLLNDLNPLPITLERHESDASMGLTSKYSSVNMLKTNSNQNTSNSNYKNFPHQLQTLYNLPSFIDSRPTEIFYVENTDLLTWDALVSSFINSIDQCISHLKSYDKLNFKEALNDASNTMASYHIVGRLIHDELINSKKLNKFTKILKKITNLFIKFRIWSTLAIVSIDKLESFKKSKQLNFQSKEVAEATINKYIDDSIAYRSKLDKLSSHLVTLISQLTITTENGTTKTNTTNVLPMIYPRFIRDKYEGGNFNNRFVNFKSTQHDYFINPNRNKANLLLDDEVLANLKTSENKIVESFKEIKEVLATKLPDGDTLKSFLEDRNLKLLTVVYQTIPLLSTFINIVESIDLTVFVMIDKLAAKQTPDIGRHDTIVSQSDNNIEKLSENKSENYNNNTKDDNNYSHNGSFDNEKLDNEKLDNEKLDNEKLDNEKLDDARLDDARLDGPYDNIHDPYRLAYPSVPSNRSTYDSNDSTNDVENNSQSFYDATAKVFRPMIQDFIHLKQSIHSAFSDLILDAQTITSDDPETFFSIKREKSKVVRTSKIKMVADAVIKKLESMDAELFNDGIYILEPTLKLLETIKIAKERIKLVYMSISLLNDERMSILNYCSRLMNSDFNIASLFIAERHNTLTSKISQTTQSGKSSGTANSNFINDNISADEKANASEEFSSNIAEITESYYYSNPETVSFDPSLPWYMNTDHDEEKLLTEATLLRGGTVRGLIAKLVNPLNLYDELYEMTFLCFFVTFVKPVKLFELLIEKYHLNMPEALTYEEYGIWLEQKLKPQQKKILGLFEKLFSKYWIVEYTSPELIAVWESFIDEIQLSNQELIEKSRKVFSITNQEEYIDTFGLGNKEARTIPMSKLNSHISHMRLQSLNINYVAEQITAVQAFYYRKINLWDLLGRTYHFNRFLRKKDGKEPLDVKNISTFIKNCNHLTHFTTFMILKNEDLNERIASIKYFIILAEKLLTLKNYSSMTAIISGLASTSISRLHKTWALVPTLYISKFQKMDNLMSIGKNYSEYRNILKFVESDSEAYLPFLGMYLSDLRFTTDGNPDWLTPKLGSARCVNFGKRMNIMKIVREVMNFNETLYNIELDLDFSRYMYEMFSQLPDEEKMYELSTAIEPRVSILKTAKSTSTIGSGPGSISSTYTTGQNNPFTGGSFSTIASSQSGGDTPTNNPLSSINLACVSNAGINLNKKSGTRRPKRYRPLLSLTSDKEKEKGKERTKDPEKEEKEENDYNNIFNEIGN